MFRVDNPSHVDGTILVFQYTNNNCPHLEPAVLMIYIPIFSKFEQGAPKSVG